MPPDLRKDLDNLARRLGISREAAIRRLLEQWESSQGAARGSSGRSAPRKAKPAKRGGVH